MFPEFGNREISADEQGILCLSGVGRQLRTLSHGPPPEQPTLRASEAVASAAPYPGPETLSQVAAKVFPQGTAWSYAPSQVEQGRCSALKASVPRVRIRLSPPTSLRLRGSLSRGASQQGNSRESAGFWPSSPGVSEPETAGSGPRSRRSPCFSLLPSWAVRFRSLFASATAEAQQRRVSRSGRACA